MDATDVLIVGAGPTGLLMAYQLARMGIDTRIIGMLS
jgi:2-polyprenyl-6-methoxyphenol hydroxylase-like FAD-dependent oxidoreductase